MHTALLDVETLEWQDTRTCATGTPTASREALRFDSVVLPVATHGEQAFRSGAACTGYIMGACREVDTIAECAVRHVPSMQVWVAKPKRRANSEGNSLPHKLKENGA